MIRSIKSDEIEKCVEVIRKSLTFSHLPADIWKKILLMENLR